MRKPSGTKERTVEYAVTTQDNPRGQAPPVAVGPAREEAADSVLLRRARSGDPRALDELCRRNWKPVYRCFARLTRNPAEAEDLTQEVFLRALRSLPQFEDRGLPFTAYLLQIARNLARDRWRTRPGRLVVTGDVPDRAVTGPGPESLAVDSARREALLSALDRLTPDHRAVLRLRILEGRATSEVAILIHRSQPAVRQLQVRALAALRAALGDEFGTASQDSEGDRR
jgi:RNA polymerase sigma-70 factor, ECF subfamily